MFSPLPRCVLTLCLLAIARPTSAAATAYPWLERHDPASSIGRRIPPPRDCGRVATEHRSFAEWLRGLPLKPPGSPVLLHDGRRKADQSAHAAVVDIDVGPRNLQQCADAIIRLRAEYLYSLGKHDAVRFRFTSGDLADFARWAEGWRPTVRGNQVRWRRSAGRDASYPSLRRYLDTVFAYAGTASLSDELTPVRKLADMHIGDVFIQGGFPGHAVLVVDMAVHRRTGGKLFLLAQSYMPAQDIHILRNPTDPALSPWYRLDFGDTLRTPEWAFRGRDLKRF